MHAQIKDASLKYVRKIAIAGMIYSNFALAIVAKKWTAVASTIPLILTLAQTAQNAVQEIIAKGQFPLLL